MVAARATDVGMTFVTLVAMMAFVARMAVARRPRGFGIMSAHGGIMVTPGRGTTSIGRRTLLGQIRTTSNDSMNREDIPGRQIIGGTDLDGSGGVIVSVDG